MIKRAFHKALDAVPGAEGAWIALNRIVGRWPPPSFSGWGMTTDTLPPWFADGGDPVTRDFIAANTEIVQRVCDGRFFLSQFTDVADQRRLLGELMWRHFIVFWSARYAAQNANTDVTTLVECGVCDGLTAHFAMKAVAGRVAFATVLYDAWEEMKGDYLLETEHAAAGNYAYLALESTRRNLREFSDRTTFVKGYIPESFATAPLPTSVAWLHIDLNAALPTKAALDTLYDRMPAGGTILFDDYGWRAYQDTKAVIDAFAAASSGLLLPVPTGQALFFKSCRPIT